MSSICQLCQKEFPTDRAIGIHLGKTHKYNKIEYVKKYILNNQIPLCRCGCGKEIAVKHYVPYIVTEYITGHNSKGITNPRYGSICSDKTKQLMKQRAIDRISYYKLTNTILPMHSEQAIKTRAKIQTEKFINKIQIENNITILEQTTIPVRYKIQCNVCMGIFEQTHQAYFRCFTCFPKIRSKYEEEIVQELKNIDANINIIRNSRKLLNSGLEIDFYLPEYKLAIEFDGLYFHSEHQGGKYPNYHLQKTQECNNIGIELLHIFEDEWINKKEILISRIAQRLYKFNGTRIFARQCIIKELSKQPKIVNVFLDTYHLQNKDVSSIRYGLFYNDELISVMTFNKPNASRGNAKCSFDTYELSRYAVKPTILCIGGASKLLSAFEKEYNPKRLITYADRRLSSKQHNVYDKLGFSFISETKPSYWYFKINDLKRYHRFNFTKKKTVQLGGSIEKTEWQNMCDMGYDRIWDCGTFKYNKIYS
jgi:very-short-patch-repair endonuclease